MTTINRYRGIGLQALVVLAGIFFFFAVIIGVVRWVVPSGKQASPVVANPAAVSPKLAVLSYLDNDVKSKRANEIIWEPAILNMPLYERDAVQTLKRSRAVITFDDKNFLDVSQNSLVIIKNIEENKSPQGKQSLLDLKEGGLRGQLEENKKSGIRLLVNTSTSMTEVASDKEPGKKSIFEITVKPDQTSTIKILRGSATVRAQGEKVELKARQMTQVAVNRPPKAPVPVLKAVFLQKPVEGAAFSYVKTPRQIRFSWTPEPSAVMYRLQIAEDDQFRKIIFEKQVSGLTFSYDHLGQGRYYWRVRAMDKRGEDGEPSEIRQVEVLQKVQDKKAPIKVQDTSSPIHVW